MDSLQQNLFSEPSVAFPTTRYQGSKAKLLPWIWNTLSELPGERFLDLFGGTGVIAHRMKQAHRQVLYNDALLFNSIIGTALVENDNVRLSEDDVRFILARSPEIAYPSFVRDTFSDVYFTDEENAWIDQTTANINRLSDRLKRAIAFFALFQSCIVKRPYNLFHRKNLYVRFAEVERSFGNKTAWDRPFPAWFRQFVAEANRAVFSNGKSNRAMNFDAFDCPSECDIVYIDPPYVPLRGQPVDYRSFYHFLEGIASYDTWHTRIDRASKNLRLVAKYSPWTDRRAIGDAFNIVFERFRHATIVVSYRSDGVPAQSELVTLLQQYKRKVTALKSGTYKYALSLNADSREILLVGES